MDKISASIVVIGTINNHELKQTHSLLSLWDRGGSHTLVNSHILLNGVTPTTLGATKKFNTTAGQLSTSQIVRLKDITLPNVTKQRQ